MIVDIITFALDVVDFVVDANNVVFVKVVVVVDVVVVVVVDAVVKIDVVDVAFFRLSTYY